MRKFTELFVELDRTTKTSRKIAAMARYFTEVDPANGAWAVYFLSGRRLTKTVGVRKMAQWAMTEANVPDWLFAECYEAVGDLAETVALLVEHDAVSRRLPLHVVAVEHLRPLPSWSEKKQAATLVGLWRQTESVSERLVINKLLTGAFRVGVSRKLVTAALSQATGLDKPVIAQRLMGNPEPTAQWYRSLFDAETDDADAGRPYPFCLASTLDNTGDLGEPTDWLAEWKWDGIRAQLVRRDGQTWIWSRNEELLTERMPEVAIVGDKLADGTVLDGELIAFRDGDPLPFSDIQRRIGRKRLTKKILAEVPVAFVAFDYLEATGTDLRAEPLAARRSRLEQLVDAVQMDACRISPTVTIESWDQADQHRQSAHDVSAEGLMLKRLDSAYRGGRHRGDWWKWKIDPMTVDAVLIYAQRGTGQRASLYTDYTFAVWHVGELVALTKAYSGLTNDEIVLIDRFVRSNTIDRFGPVRAVKPIHVFELAFDGIQPSKRHKAGVALRFPRMTRWRRDKTADEANTLDDVLALL